MTERLLTASRWLLAALFLSLPAAALSDSLSSAADSLEAFVVMSPFTLAALGVLFKVPAARGLGIGLGAACVATYLALAGLQLPEHPLQALVLAQGLGVLLALPHFHGAFGDSPRLRLTSAVMGIALPVAAFYAVMNHGAAQGVGWGAVALIALGVIGLAFQRTWSLFVLLAAGLCIGLAPLVEAHHELEGCSCLAPPSELAYFAAGALALTWLPWLMPVFRNLRADQG